MQDVGSGMIQARRVAPWRVDDETHAITGLHGAAHHTTAMDDQTRLLFLRIEDFNYVSTRRLKPTNITHLPTGFTIEGSFRRDNFNLFSFAHCSGATFTINNGRENFRFPFDNAVANKA